MIDGRVIRGVDCTDATFVRCFKRLSQDVQAQAREALKMLLFAELDAPPRVLHLHQLTNKKVPSVLREGLKVNAWTIHITRDDTYKASFTLEDGVAYMRLCDEHDIIDKRP